MANDPLFPILRFSAAVLCLVILSGCLASGKPIVADRSPVLKPSEQRDARGVRVYTVRKGDTLYSIAWRFDLDHLGLARANGISSPYLIRPGQTLRLVSQASPRRRLQRPQAAQQTVKKQTVAKVPPGAASAPAEPPVATTTWNWPLSWQPMSHYSAATSGVDYRLDGRSAAQVVSASAGKVVYAGNGIGEFERLVIVKHNALLLSAYSFDGTVLVKEQQTIKAGAKIADIKNRGQTKPSLHFELRRNGTPVDPRNVIRSGG